MHQEEASFDQEGKLVNVKCMRIDQATDEQREVRCRLVAQEPGYAERLDELFAGTPSFTIAKFLLPVAAGKDLAMLHIFEYELRDVPAAVSSDHRPMMARIRWRDCSVRARRRFGGATRGMARVTWTAAASTHTHGAGGRPARRQQPAVGDAAWERAWEVTCRGRHRGWASGPAGPRCG